MIRLCKQFLRFGVVGVISFGIDYGLLFLLTEVNGFHYLTASVCSFTTATIFNYIYSTKYVFSGRADFNKCGQFLIFLILSLFGLGLNTLLLHWSVERLDIHYMAAKVGATLLVSIWNFTTRKMFLEGKALEKLTA